MDYHVRAVERADGRAERMIGLTAGALVAGWGAASAVAAPLAAIAIMVVVARRRRVRHKSGPGNP